MKVDVHIALREELHDVDVWHFFRKLLDLPLIPEMGMVFLQVNGKMRAFEMDVENAGPFVFEGEEIIVCALSPIHQTVFSNRALIEVCPNWKSSFKDFQSDPTWEECSLSNVHPLIRSWFGGGN